MDKAERDLCNYKASLAEQAERYEEMVAEMKQIAKAVSTDDSLTVAERNMLSVAYKNVIGGKRSSQRILVSLLCKAEGKGDSNKMALAKEMKETVQNEISVVCQDILSLLKDDLIPKTPEKEFDAKVFYFKMLGDYYRYLAEYSDGQEREQHAQDSLVAYKSAEESASNLPTTSPIRLGLALNFSVFYYEILDQSEKACKIAKKAFDDAIADLDSVSEDAYKDSTLIMQLLRDNLTLWTSDNDAGKEDDLVAEDVDS